MTDAELAEFLGITNEPFRDKMIAAMTQNQRALYERMADVERDLNLWQAGVGSKPEGVIVCHDRGHKRHRP